MCSYGVYCMGKGWIDNYPNIVTVVKPDGTRVVYYTKDVEFGEVCYNGGED